MINEVPSRLLFKWIGGKKWLSKNLISETSSIDLSNKKVYIEPFVGGMGAFLAIFQELKKYNFEKIILNDVNETIISTYNLVKTHPQEICDFTTKLEKDYDNSISDKSIHSLNKTKDKEKVKLGLKEAELFYKKVRTRFNKLKKIQSKKFEEKIETAAIFLFLQDHSFNGVYRENNSGEYNTPFNWDNKKYIIENRHKTINDYSTFFKENHIEFTNLCVFKLLEEYSSNHSDSFIYLDPPYLNENEKNENQYNKDHFGLKEQKKLLKTLESFDCFLFSNHLMPIFEEYFSKDGHSYKSIGRKNIMTSKKEDRSKEILEILGVKEKN